MTGTTEHPFTGTRHVPVPQWSPVLMTGTTHYRVTGPARPNTPQWSPVLMTGTTSRRGLAGLSLSRRNGAPC